MDANVQELVDKLYRDGVERARADAEKIREQARSEADALLTQARKEAQDLLEKSRKENESLRRAAHSELQLAASHVLADLRRRVESLVADDILHSSFAEIALDASFLKEMILAVTAKWSQDESSAEVELILPEALREKANAAFQNEIARTLDGLSIEFDSSLGGGFRVSRKGDAYRLDFSDEALAEFFRPFLRKKTASFLNK